MDSRIFYICGVLIALAAALACCSAGIEPRAAGAWAEGRPTGPAASDLQAGLRSPGTPVASLAITARFVDGTSNPFLVDSDDGTVLVNLQAELTGVEFSNPAASGQLALSLACAHEVVAPASPCDLAVSIDGLAQGQRGYVGLYGEDTARSRVCRELISRARERGLHLRYHDVPLADDAATFIATVDLEISAD